jgi:hypothetical protein
LLFVTGLFRQIEVGRVRLGIWVSTWLFGWR